MQSKKESSGPLVRLGEAQRLTGLTRYTLLGLGRRGVIRLKKLPTVSGGNPQRKSYYLYRDDLLRLVEGTHASLKCEEDIHQAAARRAQRHRIIDSITSTLGGVAQPRGGVTPQGEEDTPSK